MKIYKAGRPPLIRGVVKIIIQIMNMNLFGSVQTDTCSVALDEHLHTVRDLIYRGDAALVTGPGNFFEMLMRVCIILTFVGDVRGYIGVDQNGVVDPSLSDGRFVRLLVECYEIMHEWCLRFPHRGYSPREFRWTTRGTSRVGLTSFVPELQRGVSSVVYPRVMRGVFTSFVSASMYEHQLRKQFLEVSLQAIKHVRARKSGKCVDRLSVRLVRTVSFSLSKSVPLESDFKLSDSGAALLRLSTQMQTSERTFEGEWQRYWEITSFDPVRTIYDGLVPFLAKDGIVIGSDVSFD